MKININDNKKISSIQKEFSQAFPYLKIEFFSKSHKIGAPSSKKTMLQSTKILKECRSIHSSGSITISAKTTVAELEQNFLDVFGLSVQVFRKSGRAWLETTVTDGWSLDKQNKQGESLSNYLSGDKSEGDYEAAE
jgi:hypothetical protein